MSLLKTYTDEEKRKLKLHMLSSDKHSMSSDAFILGCRSMANEIAELREALERSNFAFQANLARVSVKCEQSMLEALERNKKLLNK